MPAPSDQGDAPAPPEQSPSDTQQGNDTQLHNDA
jgi:hypothetical protein